MEANHLEDSKSSSEKTDKSDQQSNGDMGSRRSYECVFCKRGFTTAQALGGHMNIHRKDRAKSRRSSFPILSGNKVDDGENNASLRSYSYPPFQSYHQPHYSIAPEIHHHYHVSYQAFLPASGWGFRLPHTQKNSELFVDNSQHLNPFGEEEDWSRSLRLRIGPSHVDDNENKKTVGSSREDELDLELRLGHDP